MIQATVIAALLAALPAQDGQKPPSTDPGKSQTPAPALRIGVVDLTKAMNQYPLARKEGDELDKLVAQFQEELKQMKAQVENIRAELTLLKPGSRQFEDLEFELGRAMNGIEARTKLRNQQLDRERTRWELAMLQDLDYAVAQVAKDRGIDIVLRLHDVPEGPVGDDPIAQQRRLVRLENRAVLFASDKADLTPHLIRYLQVFDPRGERLKAEAAAEAAAKNAAGQPAKGEGDGK
ncbi:MAG: OmpH family outer membrane protein [Planctomycetes bacterium]|nr:OmpH family outer membrane protein [Planctomycetota bacterium]